MSLWFKGFGVQERVVKEFGAKGLGVVRGDVTRTSKT